MNASPEYELRIARAKLAQGEAKLREVRRIAERGIDGDARVALTAIIAEVRA